MPKHPIAARWLCIAAAVGLAGPDIRTAAPDNWPQFRGPNAGVVADDPVLPDRWSESDNVVWKLDVPGLGWGSPVVRGDHVFMTTVISRDPKPRPGAISVVEGKGYVFHDPSRVPLDKGPHRWVLYAVDFSTGKIRWELELRARVPRASKLAKNSYATETPVTDGKTVYVYHSNAGLFAVDFSGALQWSREVEPAAPYSSVPDASGFPPAWGSGASPILHNDHLYIVSNNEDAAWFFGAFSPRTGEELWRVGGAKGRGAFGSDSGPQNGWATPFVWANEVRTEIVVMAGGSVRSYDRAGRALWELRGLSHNATPTPFAADGLLYIGSSYPGDAFRPVYAIRPGGTGDISLKEGQTSNQYIAWSQRQLSSAIPSALVYGGYLYTLLDGGFLRCNDAKTGREVYGRQRIAAETSGFSASPWAYNGKIFALSEDGDTFVIQSGPQFKVLGKNSLNAMTLATPAIVRGSLIVRTASALYRIAGATATKSDSR
jgi:outer membrane protein assembly factor BamB